MTFETIDKDRTASACYIRSICKRQSDSKYFKKLFESDWDYFVIKGDAETGRIANYMECCGRVVEPRSN